MFGIFYNIHMKDESDLIFQTKGQTEAYTQKELYYYFRIIILEEFV